MGAVSFTLAVQGKVADGKSYGKDDELGTLNRLTDEVVKEAAKEIQSGTR